MIKQTSDLMIRGGDFYAIWIDDCGLWSTNEQDALDLIDRELSRYYEEHKNEYDDSVKVLYLWDSDSGMIDKWHKYCQKQMRDSFKILDERLIFSNMETKKTDYASKRLSYPLEPGTTEGWNKLMSTLYSEDERRKIEWAIGSIVTGDSKTIQKFMVMYGSAGTGKSTVLNIIQKLFEGYYSVFDAKALGSSSNVFALEAFKTNPLVAIQHDGDLSRIEDNTRLNSLVSHELMTINEKFKSTYANRFKCFLFMGTNKPVKITDSKSGLIRRLIDVVPSGKKLPIREYNDAMRQVNFELGAIAYHCKEVYLENKHLYDDYTPMNMMGATNDFYNFILDSYSMFRNSEVITLKTAWEKYKVYCDDAKVPYPLGQRAFKEELKNYFKNFNERDISEDGTRLRSCYRGFKTDIFETKKEAVKIEEPKHASFLDMTASESIFDSHCSDYIAQYASDKETPMKKWDDVTTKLSELDTRELHYVKLPENHIVIDFDIPDEDGNKSYERNIKEASKWPPTYAELSKSGNGVHLHYIYTGDATNLSRVYADHIEIKVFSGKSSLRRRLSKCNNYPISPISSGLPTKGEKKMVSEETIKSERGLRSMIYRNLNKEIHHATKPSIDFIKDILDECYANGLKYDVTDLQNDIIAFAAGSTNQSEYCIKLIQEMKFQSEDAADPLDLGGELIFYDVEVFPNLFLVNWKVKGEGNPVVRMINPKPEEIEQLLNYRLVGFNCRKYDNHIMYARVMGYNNEQLYNLSQKIISGDRNAFFSNAYNLSYTDVYDFASAGNKKSLKKWEIELGITHHELGLPWDQPVPEELWVKVAEYCDDDVLATEAVFDHLESDWLARQILAEMADGSYNDTTNTLTTKIIFGGNKKPQGVFNYRNLAEPVMDMDGDTYEFLCTAAPEMMAQGHGEANSILPYFPGYEYKFGKSTYRGVEVSEGGFVHAEPGIYGNVALLDIGSMHPHSVIAEVLFGVEFTRRFKEIVDGRVGIKHEAWEIVNGMLDGLLTPYIQKVINGEITSKDLANALKTAINSVYGLTFAGFDNAFRDKRNIDNIVAKRGALFMVDLMHAVQEKGFIVAHIKTDSIKIPDATPEIIQFVMDFGKKYGYTFEHEATYERMALVNDSVYIAKYSDGEWTATGKQFQVPYVFKTLFSKEDIEFKDMCETMSVKTALYLDMNENLPDVSVYEKELKKWETRLKKDIEIPFNYEEEMETLRQKISEGHDYKFVGRVGNFCPVKPGYGAGLLMREKDGKYGAAAGTKGYRWLESDTVKGINEDAIDRSYYDKLVNDAVDTIAEYGDFEWFISDDPYVSPPIVDGRPVYLDQPPWN